MKKNFKLAAALFAAALVLFASCNKKAEAQSSGGATAKSAKIGKPNAESDFEFEINKDVTAVYLTRYKGKSTKIVIPETIQGLPVTLIEPLFMQYSSIKQNVTQVAIPKTVLAIGYSAFEELGSKTKNGTEIILSEGLISIGASAFVYAKISSVNFPSTLKYIGVDAFDDSETPSTVKEFVLNEGLEILGSIPDSVESLTLPSTLKAISTLGGVTAIKTITLPENFSELRWYGQIYKQGDVLKFDFHSDDGGTLKDCFPDLQNVEISKKLADVKMNLPTKAEQKALADSIDATFFNAIPDKGAAWGMESQTFHY